jgi:hypothetical protein
MSLCFFHHLSIARLSRIGCFFLKTLNWTWKTDETVLKRDHYLFTIFNLPNIGKFLSAKIFLLHSRYIYSISWRFFKKKNPTQNLNCKPWVQYISFLGMYLHTHIDPKLFKVAPRSRILIFTFTNNIVVNLRAAVWRTHTYFGIGHRWKHINLSIFEVIISVTRWVYEKIAQNFAKTILCQNQSITLTL